VSWHEIQQFAERRKPSGSHLQRKVLFTGRGRHKFRAPKDEAGGHAGIGGNTFVAGIAGDDIAPGMTDNARENKRGGLVAEVG
jgi:hypothetical protein